jgi:hypothetical protein
MADELDLEIEVARLRGKLRALTVITVLFMLASGGLAAAVYMKVSKKPDVPSQIVLTDASGSLTLTPSGLEIKQPADSPKRGVQLGADKVMVYREGGMVKLEVGDSAGVRVHDEKGFASLDGGEMTVMGRGDNSSQAILGARNEVAMVKLLATRANAELHAVNGKGDAPGQVSLSMTEGTQPLTVFMQDLAKLNAPPAPPPAPTPP